MAENPKISELEEIGDDRIISFQLDQNLVQGRIVRLGQETVGAILARHDYPDDVARLLGETILLSCLMGSSLKFDGRVSLQIEGTGAISLLVSEYSVDGGIRAYARFDKERLAKVNSSSSASASFKTKFGEDSRFGMTIIHSDPSMQPYQGIIPLTRNSLAECAEEYFLRSVQLPSRVRVVIAQMSIPNSKTFWRGGGILLQKIANEQEIDSDDWDTAKAHFGTISDHELVDPQLTSHSLLFRLFHEQGVRAGVSQQIEDVCTCHLDRFKATLRKMPKTELTNLATRERTLPIQCQFCGRDYLVPLSEVIDS